MTQIDSFEISIIYNVPKRIRVKPGEKYVSKIVFSDWSIIKNLFNHQSQKAKLTNDRL